MPNRRTLAATRILACALALLLSACGGGSDSGPGASAPVTVHTETVGSQGAALAIDGANLVLGAGALANGTAVTLQRMAADTTVGESLRLRLAPAGQRLAAASTLTIDLPGAPAATQAFWLVNGEPVLAASTRVGDRFSLALSALGVGADGRRVPLAAGQKSALAVGQQRALADGDGAGGDLSLRVVTCQAKVAALRARLALLSSTDALAEVELIADALLDATQTCGALEVQSLQQAACTALNAAAENVVVPTSLTEFDRELRGLLGAAAAVLRTGAECIPERDVGALLAERTAIYLPVLAGQVRRGEFATEPGARELRSVFDIDVACQRLGIDDSCGLLRTSIFPDLLDAVRRSAFDECRDRGAALSVAQFLDLGTATGRGNQFLDLARFGTSAVEADLAQCTAPVLAVRVFETVDGSPTALPDRDVVVRPFQAFNDYRLAGTVRPPRAGQIVLEGTVPVAVCPNGSAPAADLVVRTAGNNAEVARRPHDGRRFTLDSSPIDLAVADVLRTAALDPDTATGVSLLIRQEGAACASVTMPGQAVLDQPILLFQLDITLAPANQASRWTGTVTVSTEATATLRGERVNLPALSNTDRVLDSTTETVGLTMGFGRTLSLTTPTALLPGGSLTLDAVAPVGFAGQGTASVDSTLVFRDNNCIADSAGRSSTTLVSSTLRGGGVLELLDNGQLRITANGLQGGYLITGQGDTSVDNNNGCAVRGLFTSSFGPETVGGDDFVVLVGASATTSVPEGSTTISGSVVREGNFLSPSACSVFLRKHLAKLPTRLLASEQVVSCQQRTVLTWQLQRE